MKIGIVGCGQVGASGAYACVLRGVGTELVLIDRNEALAKAQAEDILHATPFSTPMTVRAGTFEDLDGAGIVVIAAGAAQKTGETRLDLLKRNADIFSNIIPKIFNAAPDAVLLIASNPVDVMTQMVASIAQKSHNIHASRIIGSGTILDTARFRALLASHLGISSHSVHAYVLGEHGDSEVLHWSGALVGTIPLTNFAAQVGSVVTQQIRNQVDEGVRRAAYRIIQGKGATWFGIGAGIARLAQAVIGNENALITCSTPTFNIAEGLGPVSLSYPRIINAHGIVQTLVPEMSEGEKEMLSRSAHILAEAAAEIGVDDIVEASVAA
ncbi:MAG: L-lactate dehydrogenase [Alphaproteobacteria bacterium]|nr:L-lactate dehydrogenase [Alphaproteobacteria bacterium]OIN86801.1 MAG: L-lactate dehydrogenase [Alphaproteobacteria bacterium CG1_02_46_17]